MTKRFIDINLNMEYFSRRKIELLFIVVYEFKLNFIL